MARTAGSDSTKTRELICQKALSLSAQMGFEALTMRELANACGLQVAAIYYYFPDKQSVLVSLLSAHFDQLLDGAAGLPTNVSPRERLLEFARFHITFHAQHRTQTLMANQELRSLQKDNASLILPRRQSYERLLRQILNDGILDKSFAPCDVALTGAALLAMLTEIPVWFRADGRVTLVHISEHYAHAAAKMVCP